MTDITRAALDAMLGSALTRSRVDNERACLVLRIDVSPGEQLAIRRLVLDKRRAWLDYLTVLQRRWQRDTRRPSRARHHDSIEIRERYVRGNP